MTVLKNWTAAKKSNIAS